jgi:hypothetical protein
MPFIAEQHCAVAPLQDKRRAQSGRSAADNENIELHERSFSVG